MKIINTLFILYYSILYISMMIEPYMPFKAILWLMAGIGAVVYGVVRVDNKTALKCKIERCNNGKEKR